MRREAFATYCEPGLRFKRDSGLKRSNWYCPDNIRTVGQSVCHNIKVCHYQT